MYNEKIEQELRHDKLKCNMTINSFKVQIANSIFKYTYEILLQQLNLYIGYKLDIDLYTFNISVLMNRVQTLFKAKLI